MENKKTKRRKPDSVIPVKRVRRTASPVVFQEGVLNKAHIVGKEVEQMINERMNKQYEGYRNAKAELLKKVIKDNVLAAEIEIDVESDKFFDVILGSYEKQTGVFFEMIPEEKEKVCGMVKLVLKPGYNDDDWNSFLQALNFVYYSSYGTQYIFGTVWNKDKTWLQRREYDGAECWKLCEYPKFPWADDIETQRLSIIGSFTFE